MQSIEPNRRTLLRAGLALAALPGAALLNLGCGRAPVAAIRTPNGSPDETTTGSGNVAGSSNIPPATGTGKAMHIQYLEIVTKDVDAVCAMYSQLHGTQFGDADARLGGARTAALPGGGLLGVRAPMHEAEEPVVRPYLLVDDIESAVAAAVKSGAEIAHPPMELPGHGKFVIFFQGGIQHGLWQI